MTMMMMMMMLMMMMMMRRRRSRRRRNVATTPTMDGNLPGGRQYFTGHFLAKTEWRLSTDIILSVG